MTESTNTPITRRKSIQILLGFSVIATVGGIVGPILAYLTPQSGGAGSGGPVEVGKVEDFPAGSGKVVSVDNKPVIVVNSKAGGLKAFSAICTHLGCVVSWDQHKNVVHCPCHDGIFNPATGAVVSGPPPRGLAAYELVVKDGKVMIGQPQGQVTG
ncbi:MAG: Rieske (2Fe-2S) protein [Anaerolineae bacterium]